MLRGMRSLLLAALSLLLTLPAVASAQEGEGHREGDGPPEDEGPVGKPEDEPLMTEDGRLIEIEDSPFEALELACIEEQDGAACFKAGQGWFVGEGLEKPNLTQAVNLWQAGCTFGDANSCLGAGTLFKEGRVGIRLGKESGQVSIDLGSAEQLYRRGCEAGLLVACGLAGELLMAPRAHVPVGATFHDFQEDLFSGRQSFEVGCAALSDAAPVWQERDGRSCARLGQMWEEGHGVRRNRKLATEYWDLACAAEDGTGKSCTEAQRIRALPEEAVPDEPRTSVQPRRPRPKIDRFRDPDVGINGRTSEDHSRRFDLEGGVGARLRYTDRSAVIGSDPGTLVLFKMRAGIALWFNVVGIGMETAFSTDKCAAVQFRLITRFQHSLSIKTAIPIPIQLPWNAVMRVGFGGGSTLGSVKYHPAPYVFSYGAREYVQLEIGSGQTSGPRQWWALRVEQQQTWHKGGGPAPEHSTQLVLLAGFTFAGKGPDWTPNQHVD